MSVQNLEDGNIIIETISPGDGQSLPKKGDTIKVHYTGTLTNGKKFDSSLDRGKPFQTKIGVGQVIKGWDIGFMQLSLNQKAKLTIKPGYAYGESGIGGVIPPNATLIFEVQLLQIN